jgi:hypothetical protein
MTAKGVAAIGLFVVLTAAAGWQFFRYRAQERAVPQASVQPIPTATAATRGQNGNDERVPFSLQGRSYTAILKKRGPENAYVSVQILDSRGTVLYERALPYQTGTPDDPYSEFVALASVRPLSRSGGSGLLLSYFVAADSDPVEENTNWYQLFGVLNGELKASSRSTTKEWERMSCPWLTGATTKTITSQQVAGRRKDYFKDTNLPLRAIQPP